jgi:hypothetical protein
VTSRILVSFSGGRTSGLMSKIIAESRKSAECLFIFANTGLEDPRTLDFVDQCDRAFELNLVWVEAKVNSLRGEGTTHQVVNYETASRQGQPFEQAIRKFGIPNSSFPSCNRELKLRPIYSYVREIGWKKGSYQTAIGIRADEIDRMSAYAQKEQIIYPLIKLGVTKKDVIAFWKSHSFDLNIPEHRGNCLTCWKKSDRKLMTLALEDPHSFDFFRRMERDHGFAGPGQFAPEGRRFFRRNRSVDDLFTEAGKPFEKFTDLNFSYNQELDQAGACGGESCDIFADGNDWEFDL